MLRLVLLVSTLALCAVSARAGDGNRLTYLDEPSPYYPSHRLAKLVTPQWVGEPGVEAVVVLAIDDMRDPAKYEQFLRPILQRLKKIDGRAPVSIMTCQVDPKAPLLQQWRDEGLSLEVHTVDHPCPLLQGGDFGKAKSTYDRCVDQLFTIPGNRPVAFRMPCCDSLNTVSPRFYQEIFNRVTDAGHSLALDSSVFCVFTADDPQIPRNLVIDPDGQGKFRKYVPYDRAFVNTIDNYPYPYVINRLCWEFPCLAPSDWSAQHRHKPNNPITVADWKAALDITVLKQGVLNLVFHPHGWISSDQVIELIDHAVAKHGGRVKFLTFAECHARLNRHLLNDHPLRSHDGQDNGVRILDVNADGYMDVVMSGEGPQVTRVWQPETQTWRETPTPTSLILVDRNGGHHDGGVHFGVVYPHGRASMLVSTQAKHRGWTFDGEAWQVDVPLRDLLQDGREEVLASILGKDRGGRLRDLDGDGLCEYFVANAQIQTAFKFHPDENRWERLEDPFPSGTRLVDTRGNDAGLRFVDIDDDGHDDLLFSNEREYSLRLFDTKTSRWRREALAGRRGARPAAEEIPIIAREGTNNGAWFHSRHLWVQNEDTDKLPNLVDRRGYNELLAGAEFSSPPLSPQAGLESLKARSGFVVELMAAEPLVMDPVAFAFGADGRLWVAEMADYPLGQDGKGTPGGRIRFLEDKNGDGRYDTSTVFLEGVAFPTGVFPWEDGVLVSTAPDIFFARDRDGDGRAEVREVLFTGFAEGNQQHRVNGFVWGLDGWLYCANGDSGGTIESKKTGKTMSFSGRDVRLNPRTGEMDALTGQTQFGRNRDDFGHWFGNNNSNPMYQYVLEDRYIRRNPHVAAPALRVDVPEKAGPAPVFPLSRTVTRFNDFDRANRFTSACSAMVYRDDLFGPEYSQSIFISEPVHNLVHREVLTRQGATFRSHRAPDEQTSEFLASTDMWFRPTMVQTGPDGALWIADMYRLVIEHPQWIPQEWQQRLDLRAGHDRGRLYRISPVGSKPRPATNLAKLTSAELVAHFDSPSGWQRDTCQRLLVERQAPLGDAPLARLRELASAASRAPVRVQALWTLSVLKQLTSETLQTALKDADAQVRRNAIRLCEDIEPTPGIFELLSTRVTDEDADVRLQLACTLGELEGERAAQILGDLLARPGDRFQLAAAMSSIHAKNLPLVLSSMFAKSAEQPVDAGVVEMLLAVAAAQGNSDALETLVTQLTKRGPQGYSAGQMAATASVLEMLAERRLAVPASAAGSLAEMFPEARRIAGDETAEFSVRAAAVGLLGRGDGGLKADRELLVSLLAPQSAPELQAAAITALGKLADNEVAEILLGVWRSSSAAQRGQIVETLLSRAAWRAALVQALSEGNVKSVELGAAFRQRLLKSASDADRKRLQPLFETTGTTSRVEVLKTFSPALTATGDPLAGKQVFAKLCATCHKLDGAGHEVGPDLRALTDKSPEALLVAVLDPNRAFEAKFTEYTALTRGGKTYSGLLTAETGNSLTLMGPEAKSQTILRTDVEELVSSSRSTMPEGLEKDLTPQSLADLFAYLRGQGPPLARKTFPGNEPATVRPIADGSLKLPATACEIYGGTLVFEPHFGNLGYWSSPDDAAVWNIAGVKAGTYEVILDFACHPDAAGNTLRLSAGIESLTTEIPSTGRWENYEQKSIGTIVLPARAAKIRASAAGAIERGALIDLRAIRLVPR